MHRFKNFLLEGSLAIGEINKYDWRIKLFLKKYNDGEPFELTDGTSGMIAKSDELVKIIKSGKAPRGYKIKLTDGREISFKQLQKTAEFGGGSRGSGGGAEQTAAAESAQCVYAQCIWDNPNTLWSEDELKAAYKKVNVDTPFDAIMGLPEEWRVSSILGARVLKRGIGRRKYKWYRGIGLQSEMEERFKKLNKLAGRPFNNINKWTPADIWVEAEDSATYDWDSCESLDALNKMLMTAYAARDVMGISLKKITGKRAKVVQVNYKKPFKSPKFKNVTYGKRQYWKAKDGYINFNGGEIQFRTFPTFQAEVIGRSAKHGKVSGGAGATSLMGQMMKQAGATPIEDQKTLVAMFRRDNKAFMQKWYAAYQQSPNPSMTYDEFIDAAKGKDDNWAVSKYLVTTLFHNIKGKEQAFLSLMFRYASSASPNSAVHLKVK